MKKITKFLKHRISVETCIKLSLVMIVISAGAMFMSLLSAALDGTMTTFIFSLLAWYTITIHTNLLSDVSKNHIDRLMELVQHMLEERAARMGLPTKYIK